MRRSVAASLFLYGLFPLSVAQTTDAEWKLAHCGKRFRIATHEAVPFTIVNKQKCNMKQLCPPVAWREDGGGLTYRFLEEYVKPNLIQMCIDGEAEATDVAFDWYLPPTETESATGAVRMVCNGDFKNNLAPPDGNCSATYTYQGASDITSCKFRDDPSCTSQGPDLVAGAVHTLRERLDLLDFTMSYMTVRQITVKKGRAYEVNFLTTFQCFTEDLWFAGLFLEVAIVWGLIMAVEMWKNPLIDKSNAIAPFYDSLYWSFGSAFDPGGPGKAPFTAGGRIFMCGHWFYLTIMVATYTGVLGPFLISSGELTVTGFESLKEGQHTIAVRGPKWDDKVAEPLYLGYYRGGSGVAADEKKGIPATPRSTQFKILQSEMKASSKVKFNMYTAKSMDSYEFVDGVAKKLVMSDKVDPCTVKGAELGVYDLVMCGGEKGVEHLPDSLIYDAPSVYYELNKREKIGKRYPWGSCPLLTVGNEFFTSGFAMGFPKNNLYSRAFSIAIEKAVANGTIGKLESSFNVSADGFNCHEAAVEASNSVLADMVAGIFIFTAFFLAAGLAQGILGGMASGSIFRVVKACTTCVTQEMPHGDGSQGEQEVEESEEFTEAATEPAHTLVGKTQRMEEFLERLKDEI